MSGRADEAAIDRGRSADRVVLLTPPGRGAIATILVEGPTAVARVDRFFLPAGPGPLARADAGRILFGRWGSDEGEELVVCRRAEDRVEIHGHGGPAAYGAILADLVQAGCRQVAWTEWIERQQPDPLAAAAMRALARAPTRRTARVLLDQYHGALRKAIDRAGAALAQSEAARAERLLDAILRYTALGRHLVEPWRVVLAGRPNVGKSSLINGLLGYRRALVHHQPGTTRDALTAVTAIEGWPIELVDTAGLRVANDPIEGAGIDRAEAWIGQADLVLLVCDASQPLDEEDHRLRARYRSALHVYNKIDKTDRSAVPPAAGPPTAVPPAAVPPAAMSSDGIATSAVTGEGLDGLVAGIAARLVPDIPSPGAAVPFETRHVELLGAALQAIRSGRLDHAARKIESLAALER